MLSKQEFKERNTAFWSEFKTYMSKDRSSNGRKMNWLNYPTEIRYIFLRLEADKNGARLCFDIQAKDAGVRAIVWEQMEELKKVLTDTMGETGDWIFDHHTPQIASFCRIQWEKQGLNFYSDADKPEIFRFLREKLIAFDEFYQDFKDILILLAK